MDDNSGLMAIRVNLAAMEGIVDQDWRDLLAAASQRLMRP
jgi:hypothetical protein